MSIDGSPDAPVGIGGSRVIRGDDWMRGILMVTSSESVPKLSSESSWSAKREGISIGCRSSSSVVSASGSSSPITPSKACNKLVIRGDRFGDIGDLDPGAESTRSGESPSVFSVGTEEGT